MPANLTVSKPADFLEFRPESILQGIHQRIEQQVRLYPDNIALHEGDVSFTYKKLNGHANSVANSILSKCGTTMAQTALLLPNTSEMILGMLGALKAHKTYVPLDRNYPLDRLRMMIEDAQPSILLTDDAHQCMAEKLVGGRVPIINMSRIARHTDAPNPNVACAPLDRAYILYTSGSTGRPKGIVFLHRNLLHTTMCLTNQLFFSPSDRVTWLHSPSFGSSVVDIYCSLTNGAALYPWDPKVQGFNGMAQWLVEEKLTTLQWIPSAFRQFIRTVPEALRFQDIRIVVMGGELLTVREVELFRRHFFVKSHLVNQVGTAESYNYHLYRVDHSIPIEEANVPAGYPVSPDRKLLILDEAHHEAAKYSVGEIAIQSDYMADGYWRDAALTQTKFIRTGVGEVPVYLTGDLGRLDADGCLTHLGRKDFQLKIRGCRIEPAEIERVLTDAPGIADCVCWIARDRFKEDQLVGYVVLRTPGQFNRREVEEHLKLQLPGHMVPGTYVTLDRIPTLPSGKADRKALPNPFLKAEIQGMQRDDTVSFVEQTLLAIFKDLLQLGRVTRDTDFMGAGGDSLSVAVLQHCIHQTLGVDIPMDKFPAFLTPARLADLVTTIPDDRNRESSIHALELAELCSFTKRVPATATACVARPAAAVRAIPRRQVPAARACTAERNLIILGAGQSGREIFTWATQAIAAGSRLRIRGFLDDKGSALEQYDYQPGILGDIGSYEIDESDVFICAIGDPILKAKCCSRIEQEGGQFVNIIHPHANIGLHVELGVGIVLGPFASVTSDVKIGNHVSIGALSNVAHDTVIGDWCQISSHCGINGSAHLGEGVFIGSHACILPGVSVGPWAYIGAGSIVVRDVAARVKVFGNPALQIGLANDSSLTAQNG